jgi:hypothetical protein
VPGKKYASIKRPKVYEALKRKGYSKTRAAKIANSGAKGGRKRK